MSEEATLHQLHASVDALAGQVNTLVEAHQRVAGLWETLGPVATQALQVSATRLADLEQRGYFDFAREAFNVVDKVIDGYTPDDVHALADQVVDILAVVRRLTQPGVLDAVEHAADAAERAGTPDPPGVLGVLKATSRDEDVRRGLMVAVSVLREIGKVAHNTTEDAQPTRINPLLGSRRNLSRAGKHRPAAPVVAVPSPAQVTDECLPVADWSPALAASIAVELGIEALSDRHFKVINFARAEFFDVGTTPNIRRLTSGSGVPTKELYALFPRAPAKTAARIAGIPKPVGCI